ncbi:MAG: CPBP family intramembrane metalloprotease [Anaerolineales bacterium]|nr:CPBP family intramembrane metalloprotease [Anaerolineales bacterium]MCX7608521.1 CPBP family intramembrane metalloprotease [Anaerolineales bacterium]MDW8227563.1 type II CAAX endopeptidase family protein [Anaerolineales bacterium]
MSEYLRLADSGKNEWWRYLLSVLIIFFSWQIVGSIPTFLLIAWVKLDPDPQTDFTAEGHFLGVPTIVSFVIFMLASWTFLAGIWFAVRVLHGRPFLTLITPAHRVDWKRLGQGALLWFLLVALAAAVEALLYPGRYRLTFEPASFLLFLPLALVLIPIQTSAEELFFRAYLLQGFGRRIRNLWILTFLSGFLFMLPHLLNPEAQESPLLMAFNYFAIGALLAYVTLRDGRLELALGIHAANNLFTGIFANYVITVMPTPSLFTVQELDAVYSTVSVLVAIVLFLVFLRPSWPRPTSAQFQDVPPPAL